MKKLIEIMLRDIAGEGLANKEQIVYGIVASLALVLVCGFAGWLEFLT